MLTLLNNGWGMRHVGLRIEMHRVCFGGRPVGKTPIERLRSRWENNIKMDLSEIGRDGMEWISLAIVSMTMNFWIP